jgi:DNA-binding NarL/FixJ family response regulator
VSAMARVLVADHAPTRLSVKLALEGVAEVCAEADDAPGAVSAAQRQQPDVCLIGQSIAGGGIEAVREIAASVPATSIVLLSNGDDVDDLLAALRGGAVGYLPARFDAAQLRRAVAAVIQCEAAVPRAMVLELVNELRALERAADEKLTIREAQILAMLRRGHSTSGIAARLAISPVTVRRHISKLVHKVGVSDRAELVAAPTWSPSRI